MRRLLVPVAGVGMLLAGAPATAAPGGPAPVTGWITHHAQPLHTIDPAAPLDDLAQLRRSVGDAQIVALGEATHGTAEQTALKHRTLRFLVEELGFRSIAWEDDWTLGIQVNEYLRTGEGDLAALIGQMSTAWRSQEIARVLRWLRDYNASHADTVRFVGVEYYTTRALAYDAIEDHVATIAPERLHEARGHLHPLRPVTSDMREHLEWYQDVTDKQPYIRHANQLYDLVEALPHRRGDRRHAVALHHARQIVSYYEQFAMPFLDGFAYRDARAAENLRWWQRYSGDKVVYWAASPHTANAQDLRITVPPGPDWTFPSAGSYLRDWYGKRYLSIGFTFDHGTVVDDSGETVTMPPPATDWFERQFGRVRAEQFTLDLRMPAPPPVREWLDAPARTRGLPGSGHDSYMTGGSLAEWFDVIVHRRQVTPVQPL